MTMRTPSVLVLIASLFGAPGWAGVEAAAASGAEAPVAEAGWVDLLADNLLDNWVSRSGMATFQFQDGMIIGRTAEEPGGRNTFLCTRRSYSDFELEFEVLCDRELNSGVQIRSHVYAMDTEHPTRPGLIRKRGMVYGYQCEITRAERCTSGNFWDEIRWTKWYDDLSKKPGACDAYKDGQWNHYRILARGDRIQSGGNGVACADFRDSQDAPGFIGLQVHAIPAGVGPFQVRWKNIRIREIKDQPRRP
jgi:hypothetical protein